jgi:hypothetical protein
MSLLDSKCFQSSSDATIVSIAEALADASMRSRNSEAGMFRLTNDS